MVIFMFYFVSLSSVNYYIEAVRGQLPAQYAKYYHFLHTFLCINLDVHPRDWLENWEQELEGVPYKEI